MYVICGDAFLVGTAASADGVLVSPAVQLAGFLCYLFLHSDIARLLRVLILVLNRVVERIISTSHHCLIS
mgnify:CR=1 FL=1